MCFAKNSFLQVVSWFPCGNVPAVPGGYCCLPFFARNVLTIGGTPLLRSCFYLVFLCNEPSHQSSTAERISLPPLSSYCHSYKLYSCMELKAGCMPECFFNVWWPIFSAPQTFLCCTKHDKTNGTKLWAMPGNQKDNNYCTEFSKKSVHAFLLELLYSSTITSAIFDYNLHILYCSLRVGGYPARCRTRTDVGSWECWALEVETLASGPMASLQKLQAWEEKMRNEERKMN